MARQYIRGNTYPIKDQLKAIGCRWDSAAKSWYSDDSVVAAKARALLGPAPILNSPPPADLGTTDPAESAKQFGRVAVAGASIKSFSEYGLAKGDDGSSNGTIHTIKDRRYIQIARTSRRYLSADWLEDMDMDMFGVEPGESYQWDGVEVEPTNSEAAADAEELRIKTQAAEERRLAIEKAQQEKAEADAKWQAATVGLVCCTCRPIGETTQTSNSIKLSPVVFCQEITLPDGRIGWINEITGGDDWRTYFYVPADVATAARLARARELGISPAQAAEWMVKYSQCHGADMYRAVVESSNETKAELERNAEEIQRKKSAAEVLDKQIMAFNDAARLAVSELCGVDLYGVESGDYTCPDGCRFRRLGSLTVKVTEEKATSIPDSLEITGDFPTVAVKIIKTIIAPITPKKRKSR